MEPFWVIWSKPKIFVSVCVIWMRFCRMVPRLLPKMCPYQDLRLESDSRLVSCSPGWWRYMLLFCWARRFSTSRTNTTMPAIKSTATTIPMIKPTGLDSSSIAVIQNVFSMLERRDNYTFEHPLLNTAQLQNLRLQRRRKTANFYWSEKIFCSYFILFYCLISDIFTQLLPNMA